VQRSDELLQTAEPDPRALQAIVEAKEAERRRLRELPWLASAGLWESNQRRNHKKQRGGTYLSSIPSITCLIKLWAGGRRRRTGRRQSAFGLSFLVR